MDVLGAEARPKASVRRAGASKGLVAPIRDARRLLSALSDLQEVQSTRRQQAHRALYKQLSLSKEEEASYGEPAAVAAAHALRRVASVLEPLDRPVPVDAVRASTHNRAVISHAATRHLPSISTTFQALAVHKLHSSSVSRRAAKAVSSSSGSATARPAPAPPPQRSAADKRLLTPAELYSWSQLNGTRPPFSRSDFATFAAGTTDTASVQAARQVVVEGSGRFHRSRARHGIASGGNTDTAEQQLVEGLRLRGRFRRRRQSNAVVSPLPTPSSLPTILPVLPATQAASAEISSRRPSFVEADHSPDSHLQHRGSDRMQRTLMRHRAEQQQLQREIEQEQETGHVISDDEEDVGVGDDADDDDAPALNTDVTQTSTISHGGLAAQPHPPVQRNRQHAHSEHSQINGTQHSATSPAAAAPTAVSSHSPAVDSISGNIDHSISDATKRRTGRSVQHHSGMSPMARLAKAKTMYRKGAKRKKAELDVRQAVWLMRRNKTHKAKHRRIGHHDKRHCLKIWNAINRAGHDFLLVEDLQKALKLLGLEMTLEELKLRTKNLDVDGSGKFSFEGFTELLDSSLSWQLLFEAQGRKKGKGSDSDAKQAVDLPLSLWAPAYQRQQAFHAVMNDEKRLRQRAALEKRQNKLRAQHKKPAYWGAKAVEEKDEPAEVTPRRFKQVINPNDEHHSVLPPLLHDFDELRPEEEHIRIALSKNSLQTLWKQTQQEQHNRHRRHSHAHHGYQQHVVNGPDATAPIRAAISRARDAEKILE